MKLDHSYYLQEDICSLARDLLGKYISTKHDGILTGGYALLMGLIPCSKGQENLL